MQSVGLRNRVVGAVSSDVRDFEGRQVVWVDVDAGSRVGALTSDSSGKIENASVTARAKGFPLIVIMRSSGADIVEGFAALHGWGLAAKALTDCSGVVPIIMVVDGPAVSGPALLLGIADFVVMTERRRTRSSAVRRWWPSSPACAIDNEELGGAASHARYTGAATPRRRRSRGGHRHGRPAARLPAAAQRRGAAAGWPTDDPPDRQTPEAGELMPHDVDGQLRRPRRDPGHLSTTANCSSCAAAGRPTWSPRSPRSAGARSASSPTSRWPSPARSTSRLRRRRARFVAFCDAFNLPIVTLVDTPGFYPGKDLEWRGMIRHGAQLVFAYGRATVPRICVILRKSYGGAYIVMDSKTMGNDLCLAWPWAELAVMGAGQAAAILQRRATPEERAAFEADYAERLLNPYIAAERGYIDAVIEPAETRHVIAEALETLIDKREALVSRPHDNTPL